MIFLVENVDLILNDDWLKILVFGPSWLYVDEDAIGRGQSTCNFLIHHWNSLVGTLADLLKDGVLALDLNLAFSTDPIIITGRTFQVVKDIFIFFPCNTTIRTIKWQSLFLHNLVQDVDRLILCIQYLSVASHKHLGEILMTLILKFLSFCVRIVDFYQHFYYLFILEKDGYLQL